jgi:hypothetical protein
VGSFSKAENWISVRRLMSVSRAGVIWWSIWGREIGS